MYSCKPKSMTTKSIVFGILAIMLLSCGSSTQETTVENTQRDESQTDSVNTKQPTAESVAAEARKQQKEFQPLAINRPMETQTVCSGQLPAGWLKIGGHWNPTTCGNPTRIYENVWLIERYDDKPVGSVMTVCSQQIPSGWAKIAGSWNPTTCGSPTSIQENVIQIKRLN